jgi:hypothetical protein
MILRLKLQRFFIILALLPGTHGETCVPFTAEVETKAIDNPGGGELDGRYANIFKADAEAASGTSLVDGSLYRVRQVRTGRLGNIKIWIEASANWDGAPDDGDSVFRWEPAAWSQPGDWEVGDQLKFFISDCCVYNQPQMPLILNKCDSFDCSEFQVDYKDLRSQVNDVDDCFGDVENMAGPYYHDLASPAERAPSLSEDEYLVDTTKLTLWDTSLFSLDAATGASTSITY